MRLWFSIAWKLFKQLSQTKSPSFFQIHFFYYKLKEFLLLDGKYWEKKLDVNCNDLFNKLLRLRFHSYRLWVVHVDWIYQITYIDVDCWMFIHSFNSLGNQINCLLAHWISSSSNRFHFLWHVYFFVEVSKIWQFVEMLHSKR